MGVGLVAGPEAAATAIIIATSRVLPWVMATSAFLMARALCWIRKGRTRESLIIRAQKPTLVGRNSFMRKLMIGINNNAHIHITLESRVGRATSHATPTEIRRMMVHFSYSIVFLNKSGSTPFAKINAYSTQLLITSTCVEIGNR